TSCDQANNRCEAMPLPCCTLDSECDDGNVCTVDTCVANSCQNAAIPGCGATPDAGVMDASSMDAGVTDMGTVDTGSADGGATDAGPDATTDTGVDSGTPPPPPDSGPMCIGICPTDPEHRRIFDDDGCECSHTRRGAPDDGRPAAALLLLLVFVGWRRHRSSHSAGDRFRRGRRSL
ncbi:MAG: hypothetical protein AAFV29_15530, partial [Myxococcota bacterium]